MLSSDQHQKHFRIALFGEASTALSAHDEAEPHLMGDNGGYGGGFIVTKLHHCLAISGTCGFIIPAKYSDPGSNLFFRSGNAVYYNFSAGDLVYPKRYSSYDDLNVNIYVELNSKRYEEAVLLIDNKDEFKDLLLVLQAGQYAELRPGIQFIFQSRTRVEACVAVPVYGRTFLRTGPAVFASYQRYLFKR